MVAPEGVSERAQTCVPAPARTMWLCRLLVSYLSGAGTPTAEGRIFLKRVKYIIRSGTPSIAGVSCRDPMAHTCRYGRFARLGDLQGVEHSMESFGVGEVRREGLSL